MKLEQIKTYAQSNWKTVLAFIFLPTALVVGYFAYRKYVLKKGDINNNVNKIVDNSTKGKLDRVNQCGMGDNDFDSDCWKILQEAMSQAKTEGKNIIKLDDKYVLA
jgi:hypothetical protein